MSYSTKLGMQYDMADGSTLPSSLNSSGFAKIPIYPDHQRQSDDILMSTMPILIDDDHPLPDKEAVDNDDEQLDRASTLSISSNTFSIYAPEMSTQEPHDVSASLPRHRMALYNSDSQSSEDDQPTSTTNKGLEEGRSRAVHNFTLQQSNTNTPVLLKSRRLKKAAATSGAILHVPSSSSLSRHFRNMSDSTNPSFIRNQPSKSTLNTTEADLPGAIQAEIKHYLQRMDLESTTRAQVKSHLIQHFGIHRIDESDGQLMSFINQCIETVTSDLLSSDHLK